MAARKKVTQGQLDGLVAKWQGILRLEDWDIAIEMVRQYDLDSHEDQAKVSRLRSQRKAKIAILDPIDYEDGCLSGPQDIEQTIVHELLHVHFACTDGFEGVAMTLYEQAIDAIAWALVNLDRQ